MTLTRFLPLVLLALPASAALAAPSVREFELPPGPVETPAATPQAQGPVNPDAPTAARPLPAPSSSPAAAPTVSPTSAAPAPQAEPAPHQTSPQTAPAARAVAQQPAASEPVASAQPEAAAPTATNTPPPPVEAQPTDLNGAPAPTVGPATGSTTWWPWALGLIVVLATLVGGWLWRRRASAVPAAPQIELLLVTPEGDAPAIPAPALADTPPIRHSPAGQISPLRIEAVPTHLTRSLMMASFACRLSLANRGETVLENVSFSLDLTTAHGSVPTSEQLADPDRALPEAGQIARIEPGETVEIAHEVRLPTSAIRTLRQGSAHLYVPLLRVRAQARGETAVARTFIVGTLPQEGAHKLQPFRLDEMPQTYRAIGLAALD